MLRGGREKELWPGGGGEGEVEEVGDLTDHFQSRTCAHLFVLGKT